MNRTAERIVFVTIIAALGGVVAGLVLSETLRAGAAPAPVPVSISVAPASGQPISKPTEVSCKQDRGVPTMVVDSSRVAPGASIGFALGDGVLGASAWVGLIPSDIAHGDENVNDANDVDYQWVVPNNRYQLTAPAAPGRYDLRLHDQYPGGAEVGTVTIVVARPTLDLSANGVYPRAPVAELE